tara:strand:- start:757 stop:948 length:192 start_codon:yes stop_codon:yes gene_type:complete
MSDSKSSIAEADVRARVPQELRDRLDAEVERMKRMMPGVAWNHSAVIRRCLEEGLPGMEVRDE